MRYPGTIYYQLLYAKVQEKQGSTGQLYFYLSRDGRRQADTTKFSLSMTHWRFSFADVARFVSFDTRVGDLFVFLS